MKLLDQNQIADRQKSSPQQAVDSSEDLLRQIFRRIRLKQLVRFKLVSKRWNSLISDADLLRSLQPPNPAGVIFPAYPGPAFHMVPFDKSDDSRDLYFPHKPQPFSSIAILHSCNGLFICSGNDNGNGKVRYFVLNPTTMKYTVLPDPSVVVGDSMEVRGMCLAFDPFESPRYKVVCVSGSKHSSGVFVYQRFEVYSSETGSWRVRNNIEAFIGDLDIAKGAYWDGRLHLITKHWSSDSIYFNPGDENAVPKVFPRPPTPRWTDLMYSHYFGESCGRLHFVIHSSMDDVLKVYEMRRDYSEWFLKYGTKWDMKHLYQAQVCDSFGNVVVLYVHFIHAVVWGENDEDRFLVFRVASGKTIMRYNIASGTVETLNMTYPPDEFSDVIVRPISHMIDRPIPDENTDTVVKLTGGPVPYFESMCLV